MKILQEPEELRWQFSSLAEMDGIVVRPPNPKELILLLHGYDERGKRIFRKLAPYLPSHALILAPNGPYPLPRPKVDRLDFGYAWYFYDKFKERHPHGPDLPAQWLADLIGLHNPSRLPVTIIGFSQGGFLAPTVAFKVPETKLVVGVGCAFVSGFFPERPKFDLINLHGQSDEVVPLSRIEGEAKKLADKNIIFERRIVEDTAHEINSLMGNIIKDILHGERSL